MMKRGKVLLCLAAVTLVGVLSSCGTNKEETTTTQEVTTEATTEVATTEESAEITVFIAASLKNAMEEIQTNYNKEHPGITILYNADSAGALKTQIQEGASCDIFFSAATKQITELQDQGLVVDGSVKTVLNNKVVLIKATGSETTVTGFEDITNASNLALAAEDVPVGAYSREIFTSIGNIDDVMAMEINECANVTAVLTAVSEKSNEVGVVYVTDALSMPDDVEVIATADDSLLKAPVSYPIAQIVNPTADQVETDAAAAFLAYLSSDEALAVFEKYGFIIAK